LVDQLNTLSANIHVYFSRCDVIIFTSSYNRCS